MSNSILYLDFETSAVLELKKSGASRYSRDPSLIVTVVGWAFDKEPAQAETILTLGYKRLPPEVEAHIRSGGMVSGWNSRNFESNVLRNYFGLPLPPEQVTDTMQASLHAGLPAALGDAGVALGLDVVKDASAHRLMLQMSRPRGRAPDGRLRWWHDEDGEKLERLRLYCLQDVEAERAIARAIPKLPDREVQVALLDARANELGVRVDVPVVRQMIAVADAATRKLNAECADLTDGQVTSPGSQTARLLAWLGPHAPADLTKDTVAQALKRDDLPALARRALEIRQLAAKSSVKKLHAVLSCVDDDDAIRGMLAYYGASRTGRWAGRLFQPQNLPRPSLKDPNMALDMIAEGADADALEVFFGSPLEVISSCLRGILIPRPGHAFVVYDLSQIEARMIAWLAGQQDTLDVFASGDDIYTFTARKLGLNSRQEGKVCVAEGTLVLTMEGYKEIQTIQDTDLVWDGETWVTHKGLIRNGVKKTISVAGAWMTPDHLVLCGKTWLRAERVAQHAWLLRHALETGSVSLPSLGFGWASATASVLSWCVAHAAARNMRLPLTIFAAARQLAVILVQKARAGAHASLIIAMQASFLTTTIAHACSTGYQRAFSGVTTRAANLTSTTARGAYSSTNLGVKHKAWGALRRVAPNSLPTSSLCPAGTIRRWSLIASTWIKAMSRATCGLLPGARTQATNGKFPTFKTAYLNLKKKSRSSVRGLPVYDLASTGPHNRFTILTDLGPMLVHNCALGLGYGMGPGKFIDTAATYGLTYSATKAEKIVRDWRAANQKIVQFWWSCDNAVKAVLAQKKTPHDQRINDKVVAGVSRARNGSRLLTLLLPSGRHLYYRNAVLAHDEGKDTITYAGVDQKTRKWGIHRTYSGKIAENLSQSVSRDVIVDMALAIERDRLGDVILSVHDELIVEVPESEAQARYEAIGNIMNTTPSWAPGLPVEAKGAIMRRYSK